MKKIILIFLVFSVFTKLSAQEKILLEIDDEKISAEEFLYIYKKNNTDENAMSYNSLEEYMELFTNFKLKVHEAERLGLDTTRAFTRELGGYRSQLAQPYLNDKKIEDDIIAEAYQRMLYDIEVSHIIAEVPKGAVAEDTLKAYKKIYEAYDKLKKGEDFVSVAIKYSDEQQMENHKGNLGYRTAFGLVYPFETVMYNTPVGEFSEPFRTDFGYHILKVTDKRPAKGKFKVAHIMKVKQPGASRNDIHMLRDEMLVIERKLKNGEDFAALAEKNSDDRKTAAAGGELGWVSVGGRMIKEFEEAVFQLQNIGDISPVLETGYGFHIIKLLDIEPVKPFDEIKGNIKSQITNTARTSKSREVVLARLKDEYNFKSNDENLRDFYKYITDSIFSGTLVIDPDADLSKELFSFGNKNFTQKDFADYIMKFNRKQEPQDLKSYVDNSFKMFVNKSIIDYEESVLENKYPQFKYLVKEYHDGILLFELTDKMVWSKAIIDTAGLERFYNENMYNYMWNYRYDIKTYRTKDAKTAKSLEKSLMKNQDDTKILAKLNKKDSVAVVLTEHLINEKNVTLAVDRLVDENNIPETDKFVKVITSPEDNTVTMIRVMAPQPKTLFEARGIITADYQNYLEKEWIKELRSKYKIVVHDDVLRSISE